MMTHLLPSIEIETGDNPEYSIIWLHGLGADGNDFIPIVDELNLPSKLSLRFVFPHAPERPVTLNGGYVMRAWYDIYHADFNHRQDESGIRNSQQTINALIDQEIQRGIMSSHIFLAGFSQGGAMALHTGLRHPNTLAGILALSCYLPLAETLAAEISAANVSTPILMTHGTYDSVIPITYAIASREKLHTKNHSIDWHEYPMGHSVCGPEINDISQWLQQHTAISR